MSFLFAIVYFISTFFSVRLAPTLCGLPIIEQTRITIQVAFASATISRILSLCIGQGMEDILVLLISHGLVVVIDGGIHLYLYSLFTGVTALFLPQPAAEEENPLALVLPTTTPSPPPLATAPATPSLSKRRSNGDKEPAAIEDPEEGNPVPTTTPSPPPLATPSLSKRRSNKRHKKPAAIRDSVERNPSSLVLPMTTPSPPPLPTAPATPSLIVSETILGHGSNNAVVFEGTFQGRPVAVKRYDKDLISLATREVSILQESDDHPNVVRYFYYDEESDPKFFYIVLDLCPGSLADVFENLESDVEDGDKRREEWKAIAQGFDERKAMKQIASGLRHLHDGLGLIHRDIKPQNILISSSSSSKGPLYRMLISDFGLCKKLDIPSESRFVSTTYGSIAQGTAGWMAPEMLKCMDDELDLLANSGDTTMSSLATNNNGSSSESGTSITTCQCECLTKSVDIFALGCLFYYILTRGGHPYGNRFDREINIRHGVKDLSLVYSNEEAHDLITHMLHRQPSDRFDIKTCLLHPFFWEPSKRLAFLRDASDRFEIMSKDPMDSVLIRLERDAKSIIKTDWYHTLDQSQDQALIKNLRKSRGYDGNSLRDLLRVLRNKRNHYQDLPDELKVQLGPMPDGFLEYFTSRYPRLLVYVHEVVKETGLHSESMFKNYFELPES